MITNILVIAVGLLHIYFMVLEMHFWNRPLGLKAFRLTKEFADQSKSLAFNQGLYNGFLAAGLFWSVAEPTDFAFKLKIFFLACVAAAGIVGAMTASKKILYVQFLPAALALAFLFLKI